MEAVTSTGMVIRISFSNLFKEFKSTSTWLQFPFVEGTHRSKDPGSSGVASEGGPQKAVDLSRWNLLVVDLKTTLSKYVHAKYAYLKNMKLCANLVVRNVYTSDQRYSPLVNSEGSSENKYNGYALSLPRELSLPVPKESSFLNSYNYVEFPLDSDEKNRVLSLPAQRVPLKGRQISAVTIAPESSRHTHTGVSSGCSKPAREKRHKTGTESSASHALVSVQYVDNIVLRLRLKYISLGQASLFKGPL